MLLQEKLSETWKEAKEITRCSFSVMLGLTLFARYFLSLIGQQLTCRWLSSTDGNNFCAEEQITPKVTAYGPVGH